MLLPAHPGTGVAQYAGRLFMASPRHRVLLVADLPEERN
jgi:hypothetical protein